MQRLVDVVAARLLEGSLVPYLGPRLHRSPPFPAGPGELAAWIDARHPVPAAARGRLWPTARHVEATTHRRTLVKLLREAFAPRADPEPLHLLLAGLPILPLAVTAWHDGTLLDVLGDAARAGGRSVAVVHGLSPVDRPGERWAAPAGDGLAPAEQAETLLYQPLGPGPSAASYLVSEADLAESFAGPEPQRAVPPEVARRRDGCGFLFAGCRFTELPERLVARAVVEGSSGPHFAVLPAEPTVDEARFLAAEGITPVELPQERFVAELSRWLARTTFPVRQAAAKPAPEGEAAEAGAAAP
ncbi:MAG TPA: SIR2 family protein [Anaeromyxobacteraceae bacterium]|nr:SIR2 family protein [Anaeromyxobacteraceae bacterium]